MVVSQNRPRRPSSPAVHARKTWRQRLREARRPVGLAVILIAATLLVYAQTWRSGFVLIDDPIEVSGNPRVQAGLTLQNLVWCFSAFFDGNWIPLTWLSLMLDTTVFGFHAGGYHVTNVFLHVADSVLLFAFLARATGNQLRSACVAALFALHPLHVESVAWITERKDVLSMLFGLLSLLAYVRYADRGKAWSLAACFVCFVCSLLSKPTLVTLPFVLLLLDFWPLGRLSLSSNRRPQEACPAADRLTTGPSAGDETALRRPTAIVRLLLEKVPFLAASAVFSAITVLAQQSGKGVRSLTALPLTVRCENAVVVYAAYLGKALFPQDLAVYYPHPAGGFAWPVIVGAAALLFFISAAAIAGLRRYPYLFVGWAWYLGALVPMIGIVQVGGQQMADRYTYFPLIGLFVAIVWLVCDLVPAGVLHSRVLPVAALTALAALTAITFVQVGYWHDDLSLFGHALESATDNAFTRNKLGVALVQRGKLPEAIEQFERAIRLAPRSVDPQYNLGLVLQNMGRSEEAAAHYRAVLAIDDQHADAHNNLGAILLDHGQDEEAKKHFRRAVELAPTLVEARLNLGTACLRTGDYTEAIASGRRALELDPRSMASRHVIATALLAQGRWDEAISQLRSILSVSPGDDQARSELARALARRRGL